MAYGNGGYEGQSAKCTAPIQAYASGADSPVRMPMVAIELDRQQQAVARLHEVISNVEMRLSAILRAEPPSPAGTNGTAKSLIEMVPLAHGLSEQNNLIQSASVRLQALLERIEL